MRSERRASEQSLLRPGPYRLIFRPLKLWLTVITSILGYVFILQSLCSTTLMIHYQEFSQYFRTTSTSFQFELALARLIKVGSPALKSLTCLEANEADPGDVYVFWHAMIWAIHEELKDPLNEFPQDVQDQVIGILNSRHEQLLGSGNLSTAANVYLSGAYLNPSKVACLLSHRFTNKKSL